MAADRTASEPDLRPGSGRSGSTEAGAVTGPRGVVRGAVEAHRLRWLAAPVVALAFAAGVWLAGALPSHFRVAMAVIAGWYAVGAAVTVLIARARRVLRAPVAAGFAVSAVAIGAFLAWTTLSDRTVHERLVHGPALAAGTFRGLEHATTGTVAVVGTGVRRYLTLRGLRTAPGPDLRVRLVPGDTTDAGTRGAIDLGALKGNIGDQQYLLPQRLQLGRYGSVVIWCRAFSAAFAQAPLRTGPS